MKKENKFKFILQAIATDLLFWIYIFGCISFLSNYWFEIMLQTKLVVILGFAVGLTSFILGFSVGRKVFLPTTKTENKWYKTFWGWSVFLILFITIATQFLIGYHV